MDVLQIDGVINNGVSFYNSSTEELQNLAQRNQISRQFAATRDSVVTMVKTFQDLINLAQKEGLAGSIGFSNWVRSRQGTRHAGGKQQLPLLPHSEFSAPQPPGTWHNCALILGCFPSFNTSCALN